MYIHKYPVLLCKIITLVVIVIVFYEALSVYLNVFRDTSRILKVMNTSSKFNSKPSLIYQVIDSPQQLQPQVFRWNGNSWLEWPNFCLDNKLENYSLADLHAPSGHIPFYVHDSKHDSYTSRLILRHHTYEESDLELMYRLLMTDDTMGLVDIGSHVGLYSATAALMGRNVVTVDALYMNMHAWCHSIVKNNFTHQVKQVYTIVSSGHRLMYFITNGIHVGGTTVHIADEQNMQVSPFDKQFIYSSTLDDLLSLISFKNVFVKIDVEKHESEVISGGRRFFEDLNVQYVLMEWIHHYNGSHRNAIIDQMTSLGFKAFTTGSAQKEVDFSKYQRMINILWKKIK